LFLYFSSVTSAFGKWNSRNGLLSQMYWKPT